MKQRWISWILGTFLSVSLVAAPATAANKGGKARIPAAKRYHVTQIGGSGPPGSFFYPTPRMGAGR